MNRPLSEMRQAQTLSRYLDALFQDPDGVVPESVPRAAAVLGEVGDDNDDDDCNAYRRR